MKTNQSTTIIRIILALVVLVGIGVWAKKNFTHSESAPSVATTTPHSAKPTVTVTYFTTNTRCKTCLKIEKLTRETLEHQFANELADKRVVFQTINFDKPENKHFIKDYQLAFKTVVIADLENGKQVAFEKYDDVWKLHETPEKFEAYLADGVRKYLHPQPKPTK